jgi:hypothetical protein
MRPAAMRAVSFCSAKMWINLISAIPEFPKTCWFFYPFTAPAVSPAMNQR